VSIEFTENPGILPILERAEQIRLQGKQFSDVRDDQGYQYVDLVQEGGGVLGIALVGYTYILEKVGIRFFSLAGTSAGAINTILIAGLGKIGEAVSEKIISELSRKNLYEFVDGPPYIKKLLAKALNKKGGIGWTIALNSFNLYFLLKRKFGVNPGNNFEEWLTSILAKAGIITSDDLAKQRDILPKGLRNTGNGDDKNFKAKLAIISSDITTHTKAVFPEMSILYWRDPGSVNLSTFIRASMSIPIFFQPLEVRDLPNAGETSVPVWDKFAGYSGEIPSSVKFVDGGILSNFPINVFHRSDDRSPRMPTFGVRLSTYRRTYSKSKSFFGFGGAIISTMRQIYDYDFLLRNPDYKRLICRIGADQKFNWLNFNISKQEQIALFNLGALKAMDFLENFDWPEYKNIRKNV
jgi:NTE family protein